MTQSLNSGLIYLKFAGIIEYHPTLPLGQAFRWNGPRLRLLSTFQKQPSTRTPQSSEHSTPATMPQAVKVVGNDLVKVARRLMWYPLGKFNIPGQSEYVTQASSVLSLRYRNHPRCDMQNGRLGRLDTAIRLLHLCRRLLYMLR
jgi:hypothetical protein